MAKHVHHFVEIVQILFLVKALRHNQNTKTANVMKWNELTLSL